VTPTSTNFKTSTIRNPDTVAVTETTVAVGVVVVTTIGIAEQEEDIIM
jgi:hypothetical protein